MTPVTPAERAVWSQYIREICGVHLDETKGYLIETRLGELLRETGSATFSELYYKAKNNANPSLKTKIISAITTNETSFFRDTSPFEILKQKLVPEIIDRSKKRGSAVVSMRFWSAACSTGQEVYSIGIALKELLGNFRGYDIRILGTDISDKAIAQASYGRYSRMDLNRGLTPDKVSRYFQPDGDGMKIIDEIRAMATFRNMNLLQPFSFPVPFDVIFCRNVSIYFTEPDRVRLFKSLGRYLAPEGALIIGSTESIAGLCPEFEPKRHLRSVFYQKRV